MESVLDFSVLSYGASNKVWSNSHDNLEGLRGCWIYEDIGGLQTHALVCGRKSQALKSSERQASENEMGVIIATVLRTIHISSLGEKF